MPIVLPSDLMVSVSGVRGLVGRPLTPELVAGISAAFGSFLRHEGRGELVCVGRDSRTSGSMFERAVVAGLQSVGCRVVRLGVVPTPTLLLAVRHHGAAGAIGITASHNPAEWNALKLASHEGVFLDAELSERFQTYLAKEEPVRVSWDALHEPDGDPDAIRRHLDAILGLTPLDAAGLRERGFHVALDCVHGAGGTLMPLLLEELGCRVSAIGTTADGRFPREPEPIPENLTELGELVRSSGAEVGLAVDPDVDRVAVVDERGVPIGEDYTLALAAAVVLARTPGTVVTNLSTSRVVEDVARVAGGRLVRAPVGEINVARRLEAEGGVVGGEGNGGVILPELHLTRDGPLAAALVLQHLLDTGLAPSGVVAQWPTYVIVKDKVAFPREALDDAYRVLAEDLAPVERDDSDGLRMAWPARRSWLHVRPSGTEPVVRLIAEAPDEGTARSLVERAGGILEGVA